MAEQFRQTAEKLRHVPEERGQLPEEVGHVAAEFRQLPEKLGGLAEELRQLPGQFGLGYLTNGHAAISAGLLRTAGRWPAKFVSPARASNFTFALLSRTLWAE